MNSLTKDQTLALDAKLANRMSELAAEIRAELVASDNQHYRDLAGMVTDTADEAMASALVDFEVAAIDRHIHELREIEAARERMRHGSYGICSDCGNAVPYARLSAYPAAKRCLGCQQKQENQNRLRR